VWKSSLFFALLFLSIFSLSINAVSSESKGVQKPYDFDRWPSIQLILEKYGALDSSTLFMASSRVMDITRRRADFSLHSVAAFHPVF
jgi:hypothetical protein